MTPTQFFTRLQDALKDLVWSGTTNKLFGDAVFLVPRIPMQQIAQFPSPSCFLVENGFNSDPEHPGIIYQKFTLTSFIEVYQDTFGRGALQGANRIPNTSTGAGMFALEEEMLNFLINITELTTKIILLEKSEPQAVFVKANQPAIFRNMTCQAILGVY